MDSFRKIDTDGSKHIAAIILAAGLSSRMGDFKPLLKFGPYTAVERAVSCFLEAGLCDITVVVGYRGEAVTEVLKPMDVKVVVNTQFEAGMYSSVQAGVQKLGAEVEAFFLLPVDHPLVAAATVKRMVDYYAFSGKGILYPTFHGRRGHPPLISVRYAHGILQNSGPQGLRGLLSLYVHDTFNVSVEDEAVLLDMDVPDDYQSLLHYLEDKGHGADHGSSTVPWSR